MLHEFREMRNEINCAVIAFLDRSIIEEVH